MQIHAQGPAESTNPEFLKVNSGPSLKKKLVGGLSEVSDCRTMVEYEQRGGAT